MRARAFRATLVSRNSLTGNSVCFTGLFWVAVLALQGLGLLATELGPEGSSELYPALRSWINRTLKRLLPSCYGAAGAPGCQGGFPYWQRSSSKAAEGTEQSQNGSRRRRHHQEVHCSCPRQLQPQRNTMRCTSKGGRRLPLQRCMTSPALEGRDGIQLSIAA